MGQWAGGNRLAVPMNRRNARQVCAALINGAEMEVQVICVALESRRLQKSPDCLSAKTMKLLSISSV